MLRTSGLLSFSRLTQLQNERNEEVFFAAEHKSSVRLRVVKYQDFTRNGSWYLFQIWISNQNEAYRISKYYIESFALIL